MVLLISITNYKSKSSSSPQASSLPIVSMVFDTLLTRAAATGIVCDVLRAFILEAGALTKGTVALEGTGS